ncbi:unnamed protein product [Amoebophrya sp. A25]|nr:unnamed protein product [Amoebophrya sp. A25]|eukprot:GSA25T00020057001.1
MDRSVVFAPSEGDAPRWTALSGERRSVLVASQDHLATFDERTGSLRACASLLVEDPGKQFFDGVADLAAPGDRHEQQHHGGMQSTSGAYVAAQLIPHTYLVGRSSMLSLEDQHWFRDFRWASSGNPSGIFQRRASEDLHMSAQLHAVRTGQDQHHSIVSPASLTRTRSSSAASLSSGLEQDRLLCLVTAPAMLSHHHAQMNHQNYRCMFGAGPSGHQQPHNTGFSTNLSSSSHMGTASHHSSQLLAFVDVSSDPNSVRVEHVHRHRDPIDLMCCSRDRIFVASRFHINVEDLLVHQHHVAENAMKQGSGSGPGWGASGSVRRSNSISNNFVSSTHGTLTPGVDFNIGTGALIHHNSTSQMSGGGKGAPGASENAAMEAAMEHQALIADLLDIQHAEQESLSYVCITVYDRSPVGDRLLARKRMWSKVEGELVALTCDDSGSLLVSADSASHNLRVWHLESAPTVADERGFRSIARSRAANRGGGALKRSRSADAGHQDADGGFCGRSNPQAIGGTSSIQSVGGLGSGGGSRNLGGNTDSATTSSESKTAAVAAAGVLKNLAKKSASDVANMTSDLANKAKDTLSSHVKKSASGTQQLKDMLAADHREQLRGETQHKEDLLAAFQGRRKNVEEEALFLQSLTPWPNVKHILRGHRDTVHALAVDRDYLYSASADRTVRMWVPNVGHCLKVLTQACGQVANTLVIDSSYLFLTSTDSRVDRNNYRMKQSSFLKVWHRDSLEMLSHFEPPLVEEDQDFAKHMGTFGRQSESSKQGNEQGAERKLKTGKAGSLLAKLRDVTVNRVLSVTARESAVLVPSLTQLSVTPSRIIALSPDVGQVFSWQRGSGTMPTAGSVPRSLSSSEQMLELARTNNFHEDWLPARYLAKQSLRGVRAMRNTCLKLFPQAELLLSAGAGTVKERNVFLWGLDTSRVEGYFRAVSKMEQAMLPHATRRGGARGQAFTSHKSGTATGTAKKERTCLVRGRLVPKNVPVVVYLDLVPGPACRRAFAKRSGPGSTMQQLLGKSGGATSAASSARLSALQNVSRVAALFSGGLKNGGAKNGSPRSMPFASQSAQLPSADHYGVRAVTNRGEISHFFGPLFQRRDEEHHQITGTISNETVLVDNVLSVAAAPYDVEKLVILSGHGEIRVINAFMGNTLRVISLATDATMLTLVPGITQAEEQHSASESQRGVHTPVSQRGGSSPQFSSFGPGAGGGAGEQKQDMGGQDYSDLVVAHVDGSMQSYGDVLASLGQSKPLQQKGHSYYTNQHRSLSAIVEAEEAAAELEHPPLLLAEAERSRSGSGAPAPIVQLMGLNLMSLARGDAKTEKGGGARRVPACAFLSATAHSVKVWRRIGGIPTTASSGSMREQSHRASKRTPFGGMSPGSSIADTRAEERLPTLASASERTRGVPGGNRSAAASVSPEEEEDDDENELPEDDEVGSADDDLIAREGEHLARPQGSRSPATSAVPSPLQFPAVPNIFADEESKQSAGYECAIELAEHGTEDFGPITCISIGSLYASAVWQVFVGYRSGHIAIWELRGTSSRRNARTSLLYGDGGANGARLSLSAHLLRTTRPPGAYVELDCGGLLEPKTWRSSAHTAEIEARYEVTAMAFDDTTNQLCVADLQGQMRMVEIRSGVYVKNNVDGFWSRSPDVVRSSCSNRLFYAGRAHAVTDGEEEHNTIYVCDVGNGKHLGTLEGHQGHIYYLQVITVDRSHPWFDRHLAHREHNNYIRFRTSTGNPAEMPSTTVFTTDPALQPSDAVGASTISQPAAAVAHAAGMFGSIAELGEHDGAEVDSAMSSGEEIDSATQSQEFIVSASTDGHLCIWRSETGQLFRTYQGHMNVIGVVPIWETLPCGAYGSGVTACGSIGGSTGLSNAEQPGSKANTPSLWVLSLAREQGENRGQFSIVGPHGAAKRAGMKSSPLVFHEQSEVPEPERFFRYLQIRDANYVHHPLFSHGEDTSWLKHLPSSRSWYLGSHVTRARIGSSNGSEDPFLLFAPGRSATSRPSALHASPSNSPPSLQLVWQDNGRIVTSSLGGLLPVSLIEPLWYSEWIARLAAGAGSHQNEDEDDAYQGSGQFKLLDAPLLKYATSSGLANGEGRGNADKAENGSGASGGAANVLGQTIGPLYDELGRHYMAFARRLSQHPWLLHAALNFARFYQEGRPQAVLALQNQNADIDAGKFQSRTSGGKCKHGSPKVRLSPLLPYRMRMVKEGGNALVGGYRTQTVESTVLTCLLSVVLANDPFHSREKTVSNILHRVADCLKSRNSRPAGHPEEPPEVKQPAVLVAGGQQGRDFANGVPTTGSSSGSSSNGSATQPPSAASKQGAGKASSGTSNSAGGSATVALVPTSGALVHAEKGPTEHALLSGLMTSAPPTATATKLAELTGSLDDEQFVHVLSIAAANYPDAVDHFLQELPLLMTDEKVTTLDMRSPYFEFKQPIMAADPVGSFEVCGSQSAVGVRVWQDFIDRKKRTAARNKLRRCSSPMGYLRWFFSGPDESAYAAPGSQGRTGGGRTMSQSSGAVSGTSNSGNYARGEDRDTTTYFRSLLAQSGRFEVVDAAHLSKAPSVRSEEETVTELLYRSVFDEAPRRGNEPGPLHPNARRVDSVLGQPVIVPFPGFAQVFLEDPLTRLQGKPKTVDAFSAVSTSSKANVRDSSSSTSLPAKMKAKFGAVEASTVEAAAASPRSNNGHSHDQHGEEGHEGGVVPETPPAVRAILHAAFLVFNTLHSFYALFLVFFTNLWDRRRGMNALPQSRPRRYSFLQAAVDAPGDLFFDNLFVKTLIRFKWNAFAAQRFQREFRSVLLILFLHILFTLTMHRGIAVQDERDLLFAKGFEMKNAGPNERDFTAGLDVARDISQADKDSSEYDLSFEIVQGYGFDLGKFSTWALFVYVLAQLAAFRAKQSALGDVLLTHTMMHLHFLSYQNPKLKGTDIFLASNTTSYDLQSYVILFSAVLYLRMVGAVLYYLQVNPYLGRFIRILIMMAVDVLPLMIIFIIIGLGGMFTAFLLVFAPYWDGDRSFWQLCIDFCDVMYLILLSVSQGGKPVITYQPQMQGFQDLYLPYIRVLPAKFIAHALGVINYICMLLTGAHMTATVNRVKQQQAHIFDRMRSVIILEYEEDMDPNDERYFPRYLHVMLPQRNKNPEHTAAAPPAPRPPAPPVASKSSEAPSGDSQTSSSGGKRLTLDSKEMEALVEALSTRLMEKMASEKVAKTAAARKASSNGNNQDKNRDKTL